MREPSKTVRWDAWDMWIFVAFIVAVPFYILPDEFRILAPILIFLIAELLWRAGFFHYPKYHSKHDVEVAKKIEASQKRLEKELKMGSGPIMDNSQAVIATFPAVDWKCPSCDTPIHLAQGKRCCTRCEYRIR